MTAQDVFISNVSAALGRPARPAYRHKASLHFPGSGPERPSRTSADRLALLRRLVERGKPLNLNVIPTKDTAATAAAIAELVDKKNPEWEGPKTVAAWQHPIIDALNLAPLLAERQVAYVTAAEPPTFRHQLETAFVGITSADYCLADTATLVLKTRPACGRAVSLLPTIHVAVIALEQIIGDLTELYHLLASGGEEERYRLGNCLTMITGPSKTADIELTMVHGAHGPRELYLYVIAAQAVE